MKISSRFSMAVQALLLVGRYQDRRKNVGDAIAKSINTSPALVRRIILQLKSAGLVVTSPGVGGIRLARPAEEITLLDVYRATAEPEGGLFNLHPDPNPLCPVGRNIYTVLEPAMGEAESALENQLASVPLSDLLSELGGLISSQKAAAQSPGLPSPGD